MTIIIFREGFLRGLGTGVVKILLIAFLLFICGGVLFNSSVESAKKKSAKKNRAGTKEEPIHIVSDRLEVNQGKREIIFLGHVMAKKGDLTVLGDRMTVIYRSVKETSKKNPGQKVLDNELSGTDQIEKILAQGNVKISKGDIVAIGDKAIYYQVLQKLVLEGNPKVSRGGDFISGQRVIILLKENKSIVEGGRDEPVKATIRPKSGKLVTQ